MFIFQVIPKRFVRFSPRNLFIVDYQSGVFFAREALALRAYRIPHARMIRCDVRHQLLADPVDAVLSSHALSLVAVVSERHCIASLLKSVKRGLRNPFSFRLTFLQGSASLAAYSKACSRVSAVWS